MSLGILNGEIEKFFEKSSDDLKKFLPVFLLQNISIILYVSAV